MFVKTFIIGSFLSIWGYAAWHTAQIDLGTWQASLCVLGLAGLTYLVSILVSVTARLPYEG